MKMKLRPNLYEINFIFKYFLSLIIKDILHISLIVELRTVCKTETIVLRESNDV